MLNCMTDSFYLIRTRNNKGEAVNFIQECWLVVSVIHFTLDLGDWSQIRPLVLPQPGVCMCAINLYANYFAKCATKLFCNMNAIGRLVKDWCHWLKTAPPWSRFASTFFFQCSIPIRDRPIASMVWNNLVANLANHRKIFDIFGQKVTDIYPIQKKGNFKKGFSMILW